MVACESYGLVIKRYSLSMLSDISGFDEEEYYVVKWGS